MWGFDDSTVPAGDRSRRKVDAVEAVAGVAKELADLSSFGYLT